MSHFTVLVIGENPEEQLAPYHEFECTGENDQYVQDIDKTEKVKQEYEESEKETSLIVYAKEYYGWEPAFGVNDIDIEKKHKYGYILLSEDGKDLIKCVDRTNPNSKWDWYVLGGRWTGFFKLKKGVHELVGSGGLLTPPAKPGFGDMAKKSEIDFDSMRNEERDLASKNWEIANKVIGHLPPSRAWSEIGKTMNYSDEARALYASQERVIAWKAAENKDRENWPFGWTTTVEELSIPKDEYVKNKVEGSISTHALVMNGQWYERGRMGWFAFVSDEKDNWNEEFKKLLDSVSDDTLLSVFDCHI